MRLRLGEFFGGDQLRAIERGMADMRETLAVLTAQTPLMIENARVLADLAERVAALEDRAEADREAVHQISSAALAGGTQMKAQDEELARVRTAMMRLERQLNADAEEARKVAQGLLERIDQARPGTIGVPRRAIGHPEKSSSFD